MRMLEYKVNIVFTQQVQGEVLAAKKVFTLTVCLRF